jgi:hypothetical protein
MDYIKLLVCLDMAPKLKGSKFWVFLISAFLQAVGLQADF